MRARLVGTAAFVGLLAAVTLGIVRAQDDGSLPRPVAADAETTTTVSLPPATTATTVPTTTSTVATTTVPPPPPPTTITPPGPDLTAFYGLGAWIDVYDWSEMFNDTDTARLTVADIDRMADRGVQTLYVQTSKSESPTDILEAERLRPLIARAKARQLTVVAWYLPSLEDHHLDLRRLIASAELPGVDALAVDIESQKVADVDERNRRLLELTTGLRAALPGRSIGAIVYPPIVTDVLNPRLWPNFPWRQLAPSYDVWLPMNYQSFRKAESGYRDGYRYTAENVDRLRAHLASADVPVHVIGGIADETSVADVNGMLRAAVERRAIGGSLYDYRTTPDGLWGALRPFRR
jgi:hypothetical protein